MGWRLAWRGSAAAAGVWASAVLGFLGTVVAARGLGVHGLGVFTLVVSAALFFQLFLDLTTEDAVVKYGFRYSTAEQWGRLRRLLRLALEVKAAGALLAGVAVAALAPLADRVFGEHDLLTPLLVAALLPLAQVPQGLSLAVFILRGRYDVRGLLQALVMAFRLAAIAVGVQFGITETVLALVLAQVLASAVLSALALRSVRRLPAALLEPLAEDFPSLRRFVLVSSLGTGIDSARAWLAPLVLGIVTTPLQVGWFRSAQAPEAAFASLSAPVRLILLTEQTRDFERGNLERLYGMLRRYVAGATLLMVVIVPPLVLLMPDLVRIAYGAEYQPASDAARLILVAAALHLVWGWTKSFPVSIGRPNLRVVAQAVEVAVLVPALLVLGSAWGATGAGGAVLAGAVAFALTWTVLVLRLRRERAAMPAPAVQPTELPAP